MRTLTATLKAAQRVTPQQPRVQVEVRDKQVRLTWIGSQYVGNVQSDLCVSTDGETIVACALDSSGGVWVGRVMDPETLDPTGDPGLGWGHWTAAWTQIKSDAHGWPDGDVCISNNSGTIRIFYIYQDRAKIYCTTSVDDGATWSASAVVKSMSYAGQEWWLASGGNGDVFWASTQGTSYGGYCVYYRHYDGGWGSEKRLDALAFTGGSCGGMAALWDGAAARYRLVISFWGVGTTDGRIFTCLMDPTEPGVSAIASIQRIVPPGQATPGFTPLYPKLIRTSAGLGQRWYLTYTDRYSSTAEDPKRGGPQTSWAYPILIRSRDFEHWSYKIPMAFDTSYYKRWPVVEFDGIVYAHHVNQAYRVDTYYSGKGSAEMTLTQGEVLRYRIYERPGRGALELELDNRAGRFDGAGVAGEAAEAMRPLAQVVIDQGLRTAVGDERVECRPFYLWTVSRYRRKDANWTRIAAVDGWQLFRMWRPDASYVFSGQTLRWCIEELAARVGDFAVTFDASGEWDVAVEQWAVAGDHSDWAGDGNKRGWDRWIAMSDDLVVYDQGTNGMVILQQLLGLVGGVARWGNGDSVEVLHCLIPANQGSNPGADHTYNDGEVLEGLYVVGVPWPTRIRGYSEAIAYEGQDIPNALQVGMEFMQLLYNENWGTAAQIQMAVESGLDDADARLTGGFVVSRPNVGLELWDVVVVTDSLAGGGVASIKRRVNGLLTEWDPKQKTWRQRVYLEGV